MSPDLIRADRRQELAEKAMQGLLAGDPDDNYDSEEIALISYEVADAMERVSAGTLTWDSYHKDTPEEKTSDPRTAHEHAARQSRSNGSGCVGMLAVLFWVALGAYTVWYFLNQNHGNN